MKTCTTSDGFLGSALRFNDRLFYTGRGFFKRGKGWVSFVRFDLRTWEVTVRHTDGSFSDVELSELRYGSDTPKPCRFCHSLNLRVGPLTGVPHHYEIKCSDCSGSAAGRTLEEVTRFWNHEDDSPPVSVIRPCESCGPVAPYLTLFNCGDVMRYFVKCPNCHRSADAGTRKGAVDNWNAGWSQPSFTNAFMHWGGHAPSTPLRIGSGVNLKNLGYASEPDRESFLKFDDSGELSEVNLVDVALVSKRKTHTLDELKAIGVRVEQPSGDPEIDWKRSHDVVLAHHRETFAEHVAEIARLNQLLAERQDTAKIALLDGLTAPSCNTPTGAVCPGDGVEPCKKCPSAPAAAQMHDGGNDQRGNGPVSARGYRSSGDGGGQP